METTMVATMQAVVLEETGPAANLRWQTVARPQATPNHVLVKVRACAIAHRDIIERRGDHPLLKTPIIQGHEFAGDIVALGDDVKRWQIGDRVVNLYTDSCGLCHQCLGGDERRCDSISEAYGLLNNGGYAEYVRVAERALEALPDDIDYTIASTLMSACGVGYHNTLNTAQVSVGDQVLITGASGGVGMGALQTAKLLGATVWAVTSSRHKQEELKACGADYVIHDTDGRFHKQILEQRQGKGVDVAIDCVGTPTLNGSLRALRPYGRLVVIGNVDGQPYPLNLGLLAVNALQILGSDNITRRSLRQVIHLVATGKLAPAIDRILPLREAATAHTLLEQRGVIGRIVLTP
jgi:D-arabinose 1-dehydrogenase-like Zn-dependent alcohol dehydrogenase